MLKELRERANLTQRELAEKLDISESSICLYEKGLRKPSIDMLPKLAELLKVDVSELVKCFSHAESGEE